MEIKKTWEFVSPRLSLELRPSHCPHFKDKQRKPAHVESYIDDMNITACWF